MAVATYLDRILASHRAAAAADRRDLGEVRAQALALRTDVRPFAGAVVRSRAAGCLGVIAEVKRRSPSRGALAPDLDPALIAPSYEAGGACCLSVLTDREFFGGSADDLAGARAATLVPVLRKDFTVSALDVYDARLMGADAVLLIVAALDDLELGDLVAAAGAVGLAALVECHDEVEVARALDAGASIIGVNQRDLETFEVDPNRARRVAAAIPASVLAIAESGIRDHTDAERVAAAGYHAVLVGEHVVTAPDPAAAVAALRVPLPMSSSRAVMP